MDRDFFLNPGLHFEPSSHLPPWKLTSSMPEINFPPEQSHIDQFTNFDSIASSPVSNSVSPNSNWPTGLRNLIPLGPNFPSLAADPGFAERAAKFSCFGSRSFNGRMGQLGLNSNNPDSKYRSSVSPLMGKTKLTRVSSSPLLKIDGSVIGVQENKNLIKTHMANGSGGPSGSACDRKTDSNEESSVSEQVETGVKNPNLNDSGSGSRKRKAASLKGKAKEIASTVVKEEGVDDLDLKKVKKTEEGTNGETEKKTKIVEPPKDYIHVRARRGQATDNHSLAERVRREKISERMKLLQDLVPGCNKVTGKALMLDEIINYVQSLQHQVEFLSMKLATVNPRQDMDMNSHISKDINQQLYPIDSCTSDYYQQNQQVLFIGSTPITHSPVDPLPPVHGLTEAFSQFVGFEGDDLNSVVKMGFGENRDQTSEMKIEL